MAKRKQRGQPNQASRSERNYQFNEQETAYDYQPEGRFQKPNNHVQPKTENQSLLVNHINGNEIIIANGPAGVGKTYIVASMASKLLSEGVIDKIVLTRANVTVGKTIGLLPGTVEDKMTPLLLPILNVFKERMGTVYGYNMAKKKVEMQPLEYVRGMNFKNTFLIIDEAQNLNVSEVKALVTRYESGRIVFMGDPYQRDVREEDCGLIWLEKFAKRNNLDYPVVNFSLDDIVRSDLVKNFLTALYAEEGVGVKKTKSQDKDKKCVLLG